MHHPTILELEDSKTIDGISVGLEGENIFNWNISFAGPADTIYDVSP